MCRICVEWELGKITNREAYKILSEVVPGAKNESEMDHYLELSDRIMDKEIPFQEDGSGPESDDEDETLLKLLGD